MFSVNDVPETKDMSFTLLPRGGYRVVASKCEHKYKNDSIHSGSSWFAFAFDILPYSGAGDYVLAGRKAFINVTWTNPNKQAVEIGRGVIADIMFALGIPSFTTESQFCAMVLNREMYIMVEHKPRRDNGQLEVAITNFWNPQTKLQRRKASRPLPPPPTANDIASAPPLPPRTGAPSGASGGRSMPSGNGHPAFDDAPPF